MENHTPAAAMQMPAALLQTRRWLGAAVREWPLYLRGLAAGDSRYLSLHNRSEKLESGPGGVGWRCDWQWTSDLHAPKLLPGLGRALLRRSLADHPIAAAEAPATVASAQPEISFIIGHRGAERLPHLLRTLASIAAQRDIALECLVVEQDVKQQLPKVLPTWVRHVHTPPPVADMPYCRSWTFNVGVQHARGQLLVLHDNDMLVPNDYGARLLAHFRQGFELINLKRFIFYLTPRHTSALFAGNAELTDCSPLAITQNLECGGSVAISRSAYDRIGGMDESFIGWGGEDNEFCERTQTLRVWPYAYLPLVHLWHPAQPAKQSADNPTMQRFQKLSAIPPAERIDHLRSQPRGRASGPTGWPTGAA
jgi:hypothetical protein